ncbi:hypothetical protein [Desulfitobacterium hafniense]|nr:hypothetical protein [Desulfitobacterium hafniense]
MAKFEFEYTEIDGLLYPNIEMKAHPMPEEDTMERIRLCERGTSNCR